MKNKMLYLFLLYILHTNIILSQSSRPSYSLPVKNGTQIQPSDQQRECECFNTTNIELNTKQIIREFTYKLNSSTYSNEMSRIKAGLSDISDDMESKCKCNLFKPTSELEKATRAGFDKMLSMRNGSDASGCLNETAFKNKFSLILRGLDGIINKTENTSDILKYIAAKENVILDKVEMLTKLISTKINFTCKSIEEFNKELINKLDNISDSLHADVDTTRCSCEKQIKNQTGILGIKQNLILELLSKVKPEKQLNGTGATKEDVNKICDKLEKIIEENKKELPPWKLPETETSNIAGCKDGTDEKAMCTFDDWFKNLAWRRMPLKVQKCLIELYCMQENWKKFKKQSYVSTMKSRLEAGKWKLAAEALGKTLWARKQNQKGANKIIAKLKSIVENIKPLP